MNEWIAIIIAAAMLITGYFIMYRRLIRPLNKQFKKLTEMQTRLLTLFSDFEDMMDAFEEYAEELRTGIGRDKEDIQRYVRESGAQRELAAAARADFEKAVAQHKQEVFTLQDDLRQVGKLQRELEVERARADKMSGIFRAQSGQLAPQGQGAAGAPRREMSNSRHERVISLNGEGHGARQIAQITGFSLGEIELILRMRQSGDE